MLGGIDLREEQFQLTQWKFEFYNFGIPTEHSCFVIMIEPMIEPDVDSLCADGVLVF